VIVIAVFAGSEQTSIFAFWRIRGNSMEFEWPRRGLYAITPDEADTQRLYERVEPVLDSGGIALLQYRNKIADAALRLDQALMLRLLCECYGVPLIVNDDVSLAKTIAANGVHLGEHDGDIAAARTVLDSGSIIGVSCYDDLDRAQSLAEAGADYLAFGAFFPTMTKPNATRANPGLLREARRFGLPLVAIGGIRPQNVRALNDAGADLIAVIAGLWDTSDPVAAAQAYVTAFNEVP
jgi:thiamine-phosphate pyrophosphorylase